MSEIDEVHDTLVDLLCSIMKYVPYEKPQIGDWCYEITSWDMQNRDCRIGILKAVLSDDEFITVAIGGKEIHWTNSNLKKIPSDLLRKNN